MQRGGEVGGRWKGEIRKKEGKLKTKRLNPPFLYGKEKMILK
jgi:hypothetical protein